MLADELDARRRMLSETLADDRNLTLWALRTAEFRLGCTINRVDEAVDWLSDALEVELAASLECDDPHQLRDAESRLFALASKLASYEAKLSDFHHRLEQEKLASLKELAYGASHEINNPLANIAARAQTLLAGETDLERQRKLRAIHRQAMRAHEMIADLMLFARPPKLRLEFCALGDVACEVVDQMRPLAAEYEATLTLEIASDGIHAQADVTQLGVALQALVVNALEAVDPGGSVHVIVRRADSRGQEWAEIAVEDDGPGISDEVRRHMFDPFYSGREAGRGLGFGLSKAWRIVTEHGGKVAVQSPPAGGAELIIRLPRNVPHDAPS